MARRSALAEVDAEGNFLTPGERDGTISRLRPRPMTYSVGGGSRPLSKTVAGFAPEPVHAAAPLTDEARQRISGATQTSRQTPAQVADQAQFDRVHGFNVNGQAPAKSEAEQILSNRAARLAKDPYDLDYSENTSGTFGSSNAQLQASRGTLPIQSVAPAPRESGVSVRATGSSAVLDSAGGKVSALAAIPEYKPTGPEAPSLPVTNYSAPAPAPTATPTATPSVAEEVASRPLSAAGPSATLSALPNPTPTPTAPTPTPTPTATPTATPQIIPDVPGRALASGVSNSSAAQFEQPTKENPVPQTPTSPALNVEDIDKRKTQFAGF